jgi:hypothetical protein
MGCHLPRAPPRMMAHQARFRDHSPRTRARDSSRNPDLGNALELLYPSAMTAAPKPKAGRPSLFTQPIAEEICGRISRGETLSAICREANMPARATVHLWCDTHAEFGARFAQARELGFDWIAAECLEIANTPIDGIRTKTGKDGVEITREDMLGHRKLQIETRLKLLAKWCPKRYGDRLDVNATHAGEIRIVVGGNID